MLAPYIATDRKAVKKPSNRFVPDTTPEKREKIRSWARKYGYDLDDDGKIPNLTYRAYQAAHA